MQGVKQEHGSPLQTTPRQPLQLHPTDLQVSQLLLHTNCCSVQKPFSKLCQSPAHPTDFPAPCLTPHSLRMAQRQTHGDQVLAHSLFPHSQRLTFLVVLSTSSLCMWLFNLIPRKYIFSPFPHYSSPSSYLHITYLLFLTLSPCTLSSWNSSKRMLLFPRIYFKDLWVTNSNPCWSCGGVYWHQLVSSWQQMTDCRRHSAGLQHSSTPTPVLTDTYPLRLGELTEQGNTFTSLQKQQQQMLLSHVLPS